MSNYSVPSNVTANAIKIDGARPTISSALTMNTDRDGKIDHCKIMFSEAVHDNSLPGFVDNSTLSAVTNEGLVGGTTYTSVQFVPAGWCECLLSR